MSEPDPHTPRISERDPNMKRLRKFREHGPSVPLALVIALIIGGLVAYAVMKGISL